MFTIAGRFVVGSESGHNKVLYFTPSDLDRLNNYANGSDKGLFSDWDILFLLLFLLFVVMVIT